ncbi:MAG: hypothetical protein A2096_04320 [Spirochaetes bacterium GWF1_41_5]|nr:MAG: hypothetical protein A2096_04320 [Spirochaetes bacterium GWF1_41_5]HBE01348.1 hypothetical protein [Spirochaetia bacterium]
MSDLKLFWGDLHAHCGMSYGTGSLENALLNAREHLDFACVSGHAVWHDMTKENVPYQHIIDYHQEAFDRLEKNWKNILLDISKNSLKNKFIGIPGFEWHSMACGDYNVYYPKYEGKILRETSLTELEEKVKAADGLMIPHHIAYIPGNRSIDWNNFPRERSPLAEIYSTHGCGEADDAPLPYYHTMGPRDYRNTARSGLALGKKFGFIASTDNHSGYPGSYGSGKMGVFAEELSMESLWEAFFKRRTITVTGDAVALKFSINNLFMGEEGSAAGTRLLHGTICGSDKIDLIEIIKNGRVVKVICPENKNRPSRKYKIRLEWGWGHEAEETKWNGSVKIDGGKLSGLEKCFGAEQSFILPKSERNEKEDVLIRHRVSSYSESGFHLESLTRRNPHPRFSVTNSAVMEIEGNHATHFYFEMNGTKIISSLKEILEGSRGWFTRGWVTPAFMVHKAVPENSYHINFEFEDQAEAETDYYYVRARQANGHYAWSSPIWVK